MAEKPVWGCGAGKASRICQKNIPRQKPWTLPSQWDWAVPVVNSRRWRIQACDWSSNAKTPRAGRLLGQLHIWGNIRRFVYIRSAPQKLFPFPYTPHLTSLFAYIPSEVCKKCPLWPPRPPFPLRLRTPLLKKSLRSNRCIKATSESHGLKRFFKSIAPTPHVHIDK